MIRSHEVQRWAASVVLAIAATSFVVGGLASAGVLHSARGWIWGGGVTVNPPAYPGTGWWAMNSLDCDLDGDGTISVLENTANSSCGAVGSVVANFGVNVPTIDGDVTGHAWSEHYGWLSFEDGDVASGCPIVPCTSHREGNALRGWARILAAPVGGGNAGGWQGWVSLSGAGYGVTIGACNTMDCPLTGFAWSDELGWLDFSGARVRLPLEVTVSLTGKNASGVDQMVTNTGGNLSVTIPVSGSFTMGMTSTGADSCLWSRTTASTTGASVVNDFTNVPLGGLSYAFASSIPANWAGANRYVWTFTCTQAATTISRTVTLTVLPPAPVAELTPAEVPPGSGKTYLGNRSVGVPVPLAYTVKNIGEIGSVLTGSASLGGTSEFVCASGCAAGFSLTKDSTHPIALTITPDFPLGLKSATLSVDTNANDLTRIIELNAISPFTLSTPIDFGRVVVGKEKTLAVTITNTSVANFGTGVFALIQSPDSVYFCDASAPIAKDAAGCHYDLGPGRSTTLTLRFKPIAARSYTDGEGIPIGNYELDPSGVPLNAMIWTIAGVGVPPVSGFRER